MPGRRKQKRTDRSKLDATPPWQTRVREEPEPTSGPYDERDAPDDDVQRVDLGALRVPVVEGFDVRLDIDEAQQVISATLANEDGTMQLGVFAAPRNEGIWDEVRAEIAESLGTPRKSAATEKDGPFGTELHGTVPAEGAGGLVPVRFIGVDGPRWFLRALLAGPVATDAGQGRDVRGGAARRGRGARHRTAAGARAGAAAAAGGRRAAGPHRSTVLTPRRRGTTLGVMGHRPSLLHRLTASPQRLDAAELQDEVEERRCVPMCDLRRGSTVKVVGRLRAVVYTPSETVPDPGGRAVRRLERHRAGLARPPPHRRRRARPPGDGPRPGGRAQRPAGDLQPLLRAARAECMSRA